MVPTEAGQLILDYHREHTAHQHDMLAKVDAMRGLHSGSVSVVSGEGFAQELIDGPIRNFRQQYPCVSISLEIYGTTEIMRRIREDAAEIGLVYYPPADSHITARGTARQPMHAIVHAQHPLASAPPPVNRQVRQRQQVAAQIEQVAQVVAPAQARRGGGYEPLDLIKRFAQALVNIS